MNLNNYILKNGQVFLDGKFVKCDIEIVNGVIVKIGDLIGENEIDCSNKIVCASFIDPHVHLRTPGFSEKEDLYTGSMAALKGGYSHIFSMPNTKPCMDDYNLIVEHLAQIKSEAKNHVIPYSAASKNLAGLEMVDIAKIGELPIAGFSDDGRGIQSDELMKKVLIEAGKNNKVVSAHCEDENEFSNGMGSINLGITSQKYNMVGINNKSEYAMIERDLKIIESIHNKYNYQYHVCHLSTKQSLQLIEQAKLNNFNVSCEVTPHHLISDDSEIDINDSNYKMNPPLRSTKDVEYLIEGLNNGSIEVIATDHAPHTELEKAREITKAPFGIIGLELAFSLLYTYLVKTNKVKLETILQAMSANPARIFNIDNSIKIGNKAYLNVIDLSKNVTYTKDNLLSKSSNTFYLNRELSGCIEISVFVNDLYMWEY